ncbi:MAG TPA: hypothetical protein VMZ28_20080 [Kofleriaceae bacterium]|nr:hypothetical protein [Kofleriaceae bacterium]
MRRAAAVLLCTASSAAAAGGLSATHGKDVIEASHRVEVAVDGRVVRVRDTRRIENRDGGAEEAVLAVDVVERGAAVGMRARMGGAWGTGQVLAPEAASGRYEALTTGGAPGGRRGPALLSWTSPGELELAAFPLRRGRPLDVEIDAVAAPCAVDGLAVVYLPVVERDAGLAVPELRVRGARSWIVRAGAAPPPELEARWSRLVERCASVRLGDRADAVVWQIDGAGPPVRAGLARLDLASGRQLVRLEIDVAHELAPMPRRARVVFVIDASVSQGADGVAAQLALAQAALSHVPDAEVELVLYRRHASPVLGHFEPAGRLARRLARVPRTVLAVENGSDLDQGLALAGALLRRAGGGRPARVIAFTDDLLRDALGPEGIARALGALPDGAVVHLVSTSGGGGDGFERNDEHPFAAPVARTGGMTVAMDVAAAAADASAATAAMRGLMQPLTIDLVSLEGGPALAIDAQLPAGESLRLHGWATRGAAAPIVLRGRVWGRAIDRAVAVAPELDAALPALVVGDDELWSDLDAAEQLETARRAHAVSPVTSLLVDPGAPATSYGEEEVISGFCGCDGGRGFASVTHCGGVVGASRTHAPTLRPVDPVAALARELGPAVAGCVALHGGAVRSLDVEVTYEEIVSVQVDAASAALRACATEAAWDLALDRGTFRVDHATHHVL